MSLRSRLIAIADSRHPDFVIGGGARPYLRRWFVIPRNPFFNVYLHQFLRSDDDRALHDHPWLFNISWVLRGAYVEHTIKAGGIGVRKLRIAGSMKFRLGPSPHRLELTTVLKGIPLCCWTLFITGPRVRRWGFHCAERGWVHWRDFTAPGDSGAIGKGCEG